MTTQSLRGLDNHGAMHWRGDRNGAVEQSGAPVIDPQRRAGRLGAAERGIFDESPRSPRSTSRSPAWSETARS